MNASKPIAAALALLLCLIATSCRADNVRRFAFGGGANIGSISSDHPSIDGQSGWGPRLTWGYQMTRHFALEMEIGFLGVKTPETNWTPDGMNPDEPEHSADLFYAGLGVTAYALPPGEARFAPWASLMVNAQSVSWNDGTYDSIGGFGFAPGVGVDIRIYGGHTLRLEGRMHFADLDSSYAGSFKTRTSIFGISYLYRFGSLGTLGPKP